MNRRRAMAVLGAAALTSCRRREPLSTFSSIAFGIGVRFQTHGISQATFDEISGKCSTRTREIESLFSLYDPDSAISRLNRDGKLANPDPEFLKLIRTALRFSEDTNGVFDVTVQPLWEWRQRWKAADQDGRAAMVSGSWDKTLALVDFRKVTATGSAISFAKPGMAITLNGIVQGYATDQVTEILRASGVRNALVNIGEYAAMGNAPGGGDWTVELAANGETIALPSGRALAVSAGSGHTFDPEGRFHHIFRPSDGANLRPESSIVVTAPTATEADALSTTFTVASETERKAILGKFPEAGFREIR